MDIANCREKANYNAAVMSGKHNNVQKCIKDVNSKAKFIPH